MFTADAVEALGGPAWLRARRHAAFERFSGAALPSEVEEIWRYSRISELDLDAYGPAGAAQEPSGLVSVPAEYAGVLVSVNGRVMRTELDPALAARGVVLGDAADLSDGEEALGALTGTAPDPFVDLNTAFLSGVALVRVPRGTVVDRPIAVTHWLAGRSAAAFPRTVVQVGADAEVSVLDRHASIDPGAGADGEGPGLSVPVTELDVADAGRLRYLNVQMLGHRVWQVGHQVSRAGRDATLKGAAVAFGGDYARLRADARLTGRGASSELLAVYFGEGQQVHDFRTLQDHVAPSTTSDLLFKGAVQGMARSVYSGLIRVEKEAQGTNAFQTNRNLVLSDGAHADSVPNLEIEANDVRCSHASAVGPIDEDQRYYLESRGIPPQVAERLIVLGFFDEVLDRLPVPGLQYELRAAVGDKLARRPGH